MKSINVVAAVIKKDNQVMITQRLAGEFSGLWEFPGGKIEKNETPQQALKREINEELEIAISIQKFLATVEYDYPAFHLNMDCFIYSYETGYIKLNNHSAYKWINIDKHLKNINWVPADAQIIDLIIDK